MFGFVYFGKTEWLNKNLWFCPKKNRKNPLFSMLSLVYNAPQKPQLGMFVVLKVEMKSLIFNAVIFVKTYSLKMQTYRATIV